jgi:mannan endo-1,6-alpha-mannosidase
MIDYWRYTGDSTYNAVVVEALTAQNGGDPYGQPFLSLNWTINVGNDDQGFWALAGMQAAELGFPAAPPGQPSWLELAQGVFDILAARWVIEEAGACKGGLRWAVITDPAVGNDKKNTLSTAVLLDLGARLARYTGNQTYADWADKTWTWLADTGLVGSAFNVLGGTYAQSNCTRTNAAQWSHVAGVLIEAAAYMSNHVRPPTLSNPLLPLSNPN